jgi:hypothetical protein
MITLISRLIININIIINVGGCGGGGGNHILSACD